MKSTQIAMGGLSCALALILMFGTGLVPFAEYALPAIAGLVLIAMAQENGTKAALAAFLAISLLGLFVVPIKEAACLFLFFFGYYPILYSALQRLRPRLLRMLVKFAIFNVCVVCAYLVIIYAFGLTEVLEEFGSFGRYSALVLLALGNVFFVVYDKMVGNVTELYIRWFRPKLLKKMR